MVGRNRPGANCSQWLRQCVQQGGLSQAKDIAQGRQVSTFIILLSKVYCKVYLENYVYYGLLRIAA